MDEMREGISNDAQRPDEFPVLTKVIWFRRILAVMTILIGLPMIVSTHRLIPVLGACWANGQQLADTSQIAAAACIALLVGYALAFVAVLIALSSAIGSFLIARGLSQKKEWAAWLVFAHNAFILLPLLAALLFSGSSLMYATGLFEPAFVSELEMGDDSRMMLSATMGVIFLGWVALLGSLVWETRTLIRTLREHKRGLHSNEGMRA